MGHEAIIYGAIIGASYTAGDRLRILQQHNRRVLEALPDEDPWPGLTRGVFAVPAESAPEIYMSQVIHFGLSTKDDPYDRSRFDPWFQKFERLLRQLFWYSAVAHLETELDPPRRYVWLPTERAVERMVANPSSPIDEWTLTVNAFKA